jgi:hypothetical protein
LPPPNLLTTLPLTLTTQVHKELKGFRAKRQLLSVFAPHFPYDVTMRLFGVGRMAVYHARLHAGEYGGARPVPPSLTSYRISPEAAEGVTAFVSKPEYTQTLASAPGVNSTPITELTLRPEALWRQLRRSDTRGSWKGRAIELPLLRRPAMLPASSFEVMPLRPLRGARLAEL